MKHLASFLLFTALGANASTAYAHTELDTHHINITQSDIQSLSQSIAWHRLLLYPEGSQRSTLKNSSQNKGFFVSGHFNDPHAELLANIEQLSNPKTRQNFTCKFPARTHWLTQNIPSLKNLSNSDTCEAFERWADQIDAKALSLIHAEEHINRTGSFFAHTLVKIDSTKSLASGSSDDAYFFNFATDEQVESSTLRTLRGRNPATMTIGRFTEKQASYLIEDERDLWQFHIDLPQDEIDQIIRHLWEVKDLGRFYNFFYNNCASEILRLIDVANVNYHLSKDAGKIISPIEVGRTLDANGMLKTEVMQPSRRTVLMHDLPMDEHTYKTSMTHNMLPVIEKPINNPLLASATHRVHVGIEHSNLDNTAHVIGFRGAYQDLLDRHIGKRQFINTNVAQIEIMHHDKIELKNATLIDFLAFNPKNAPFPKGSYGGHFKLNTVQDGDGDTHLALNAGGAYGSSWVAGEDTLCYLLGTGTAQVGNLQKGYRLGIGPQLGCAYHINDNWRGMADIKLPLWYQDDVYLQPMVTIGTQYDLNNSIGIRLLANYEQLKNNDKKEVNLSVVKYFD